MPLQRNKVPQSMVPQFVPPAAKLRELTERLKLMKGTGYFALPTTAFYVAAAASNAVVQQRSPIVSTKFCCGGSAASGCGSMQQTAALRNFGMRGIAGLRHGIPLRRDPTQQNHGLCRTMRSGLLHRFVGPPTERRRTFIFV